jgi:phage tail-like protein
MADLKPIPTSRFMVEFGDFTEKFVKSISEITFTGQTAGHEKPIASKKGGKTLWQSTSSGFEENPNITMEVYVTEGDMEWYNWMLDTMPKSEGGNGKWADNRLDGAIKAYNSADEVVLAWDIKKAWIKSYKVSDFASDSKDLAVETYEIVCESITRSGVSSSIRGPAASV